MPIVTRRLLFVGAVAAAISASASLQSRAPDSTGAAETSPAPASPSQTSAGHAASTNSLQGEWTLNAEASTPTGSDASGAGGGGQPRRGGGGGGHGGGRRGGFGGGGFGGAGFGGGGGNQGAPSNSEAAQRQREAMRAITTPAQRLTIVQTDTTVILTTDQGQTIRLAPNGKGVKDDNTGIERKTKWDSGKLVSEISGLSAGKITQSLWVDPDKRQLHVATVLPNRSNSSQPITLDRVYDADQPAAAK